MKKTLALTLAAVAGAAGLLLARPDLPAPERPARPTGGTTVDDAPLPLTAEAPHATAGDAEAAAPPAPDLEASPAVRTYRERQRFEQRARAFFEGHARMAADHRRAEAEAIARELDRYEAAGQLSANEAILLRLGLARAVEPDPEAYRRQAQALIQRYRTESEERLTARPDPALDRYKELEARIVAEVSAMERIPEGLSRDEYLRRRLQEARSAAWGRQ